MSDEIKIHSHPISGSSILPVLRTQLPSSLTVYHRIQLNRRTENAHLLASFSETTTQPTGCYVVVFLDRSVRPETEVFLYLSSQASGCTPSCASCRATMLALLKHIAFLDPPTSIHVNPNIKALSKYAAHLSSADYLLIGALAELPGRIIEDLGVIVPEFAGMEIPYIKYLFQKERLPRKRATLPESLRWGKLSTSAHFELVLSRSEIPRQASTLARIPSLGIFPTTEVGDEESLPIAWGFLGVDGSLVALHVEEESRNRGLARALAAELVESGMGETELGSADIAVDNKASRRVCEVLGGVDGGLVYWVRIDLGKVRSLECE